MQSLHCFNDEDRAYICKINLKASKLPYNLKLQIGTEYMEQKMDLRMCSSKLKN